MRPMQPTSYVEMLVDCGFWLHCVRVLLIVGAVVRTHPQQFVHSFVRELLLHMLLFLVIYASQTPSLHEKC